MWGDNPFLKQSGNFMNNKEMPEGLSRLGQIFWRVEVEDKDISHAEKEIVEKIIRERKGEKL